MAKSRKTKLLSPKELVERCKEIGDRVKANRQNREDVRRNTNWGAFMRTKIGFPVR